MSLAKSTLDPNEDEIFRVISDNSLDRNQNACSFIELLNNAKMFSSIALNGVWGSGKTFFIKQTKMLIDYLDPVVCLPDCQDEDFDSLRKNGCLKSLINDSNLSALYFDAWLYDDSPDPLKSLLYFLATSYSKSYSEQSQAFSIKVAAILDTLNIWSSGSADQLRNAFQKHSSVQELYDLEELKNQLRSALEDLIIDGNRLVIFVDELDRCNPVFAVKFLERIKHFFNTSRVLFVFAVNMDQLSATIKKAYGSDFNSSGYLNKFFDIILDLPPVNKENYLMSCGFNNSHYYIDTYIKSLITGMHMSLRDTAKYLDSLKVIYNSLKSRSNNYGWDREYLISEVLLCPLVLALRIVNFPIYHKFVSGTEGELFWSYVLAWKESSGFISRNLFEKDLEPTIEQQKEAIIRFYNASMGNSDLDSWKHINSDIDRIGIRSMRAHVLRLCSLIGEGHDYTLSSDSNDSFSSSI